MRRMMSSTRTWQATELSGEIFSFKHLPALLDSALTVKERVGSEGRNLLIFQHFPSAQPKGQCAVRMDTE